MTKSKNPETISLHAGWRKDETTNSVAVPIHATSSYQFDDADHAASLFNLQTFRVTKGLNHPTPR